MGIRLRAGWPVAVSDAGMFRSEDSSRVACRQRPVTRGAGSAGWARLLTRGLNACASRSPNSLAESRIEATLRGAWRLASSNEVGSHASLKGHTPLTFADGHMVARAELNNVR